MRNNKKKNIFFTFLNYIKSLFVSFFGFLFNLFSSGNKVEQRKIKNTERINNEKDNIKVTTSTSSYSSIEPDTLVNKHEDYSFSILDEDLKDFIKLIFCEEFKIEEKELSEPQKEFIKKIEKEYIPIIKEDINSHKINDKQELKIKVKDILKIELEKQLIKEQNIEVHEKKVITPLVIEHKPEILKDFVIPITSTIKEDESPKKIIDNTIKKDVDVVEIKDKEEVIEEKNNTVIPSVIPLPIMEEEKTLDVISSEQIKVETPTINSNIEDISEVFLEPETVSPIKTIDKVEALFDDEVKDVELDSIPNINESKNLEDKEDTLEEIKEQPKEKEEVKKEEKKEEFDVIDFKYINNTLDDIDKKQYFEIKKENLEDKDYDILENKIQVLLDEIERLKDKNLSVEQRKILNYKENQLLNLKEKILLNKQKDIQYEESILEENIMNSDLEKLEIELRNMHLENNLDYQNYLIKNLEELDSMNQEKANMITKELLKLKLKKASRTMEIASILALPFVRNRYFLYFTMGLFVNRRLKFFHSVLNHKTIEYTPEEVSHIKKGVDALDSAIDMNEDNIDYLDYLEREAYKKYPSLIKDQEYLLYLNDLKLKLLKQQERMMKKEKMTQKYHLKTQKQIRKLKKKNLDNAI